MKMKKLLLFTCVLFTAAGVFGQDALNLSMRRGKAAGCSANLKQIGVALVMHENDFNAFPEQDGGTGLAKLVENGYLTDASIQCPAVKRNGPLNDKNCPFIYIGGLRSGSASMPVVFDKLTNHPGEIEVLFADGHIQRIKHKAAKYADLLGLFPNLNPTEKELLQKKLQALDKANIAADKKKQK